MIKQLGQTKNTDVLRAKMFGSFQLYYGSRPLTGEKTRDGYFTGLMQILLHNVSAGVSRDSLEDALFGDRDVENRHQALQTIVYKAKKKLNDMGVPEGNPIYSENGIYYWTRQIPVEEDAALFDEYCRQVKTCPDETERLELTLEACYQYKGEFLSAYVAVLWAGAEARRYRRLFCECVEKRQKNFSVSKWYASIVLCIDQKSGTEIEGYLYHGYSTDKIPIRGYEDFLGKTEHFLDELGFPHRGTGDRDINGNTHSVRRKERMTKIMKDEELLKQHGDKGTFVIRIKQRQHSSWQGNVTWLDGDKAVSFRSALELLKIIDGALDESEEDGQ